MVVLPIHMLETERQAQVARGVSADVERWTRAEAKARQMARANLDSTLGSLAKEQSSLVTEVQNASDRTVTALTQLRADIRSKFDAQTEEGNAVLSAYLAEEAAKRKAEEDRVASIERGMEALVDEIIAEYVQLHGPPVAEEAYARAEAKAAKAKAEAEAKAKADAEAKAKADAEAARGKNPEAAAAEAAAASSSGGGEGQAPVSGADLPGYPGKDCVSGMAFKTYVDHVRFRTEMVTWVQKMEESDPAFAETKKLVARKVNIAINQISAGEDQIRSKVRELKQLIADSGNARPFTLSEIARRIVGQGDTSVHTTPAQAMPYALTCVFLIGNGEPELETHLLAEFHRKCIYTVPYLIDRASMSADDFLTAIGKRKSENTEQYVERMTGIATLYGVFLAVYKPFHPKLWSLFARILNLPAKRTTASILCNLFAYTSAPMHASFGTQFEKLILYLVKEWIPQLPRDKCGQEIAFLTNFVQETAQQGVPKPPKWWKSVN